MLERRVSLLCLLLGSLIYHNTSVYALGCLASKNSRSSIAKVEADHPGSIGAWPHGSSDVVAQRRAGDEPKNAGGGHTTLPIPTPTTSSMTTTTYFHSGPTPTGVPCALSRRLFINNNPLVTISSLSSALALATASALSISQEFASSLEELQSSAEFLAASASSAVSAAEESASKAIAAAQASAASSVRQAMADATAFSTSFSGALAEATYSRAQAQLELEAAEGAAMSVTRAAVAIVVSIVVATLSAILGIYLFIRYRRARRKRQQEQGEEEKAQERPQEHPSELLGPRNGQEQDDHELHEFSATAALARAVVSYIEKEQMPTPVMSATPANVPTPATPAAPTIQTVPPSPSSSERRNIGFAVGGEVDDPLWVQQNPPPSHPPPPTPIRCAHKETSEIIRRTPSHRRAQSDRIIYGEIITYPLECVPTNESAASRPSEDEGCRPGRDGRRDSNWPLPKAGWL